MENTNNIQGRCATCKHWERSTAYLPFGMQPTAASVGKCAKVIGEVMYYDTEDTANDIIPDGRMDGCNVFTHENFGCIHYEPKHQ